MSCLILPIAGSARAAAPKVAPEPLRAAQAQPSLRPNATFTHITTEQGLSDPRVSAFLQDRAGFMWFGTLNGLNRYDGYSIVTYRNDPTDPYSLSGSNITDLYEDRSGTLWVGTRSGLNAFDRRTERFSRYLHDPANPYSLSHNVVIAIYEDRAGVMWVGTSGGLNRFDPASGRFTVYRHDEENPQSLSNDRVRAIDQDQTGALWVGTGGGLNRFDPASGTFTVYRHDEADPRSLSHDVVFDISIDRSGTLWVGTDGGGLDRFDPASNGFIHYRHDPDNPNSLSDDRIDCLFEDASGALWIGTFSGGLSVLDPARSSFTVARYDPANSTSLNNDSVTDIAADRSGLIWIGTSGGVNLYNPRQQAFTVYRHVPQDESSLASNSVSAIYEDADGILWIGTRNQGLERFDRRNGRITHYPPDPVNPQRLGHPYVVAIQQDQAGALWVGTYGGGLYRLDPKSGRFTAYRHDPKNSQSLSSDAIGELYLDRSGALWIGTNDSGLNRFDPRTGIFTRYRNDPENPQSLSNDSIWAITQDQSGSIWVGTFDGGLNRLDPASGRITRYTHDPKNPASLADDTIYDLHIDRAGVLWVGTYGSGLDRFDPASGRFTHYRERDGLAGDRILSLLEDGDAGAGAAGNLWITTSRGLSKLEPDRKTFHTYDTADGLPSTDYDRGHFKTRDGELLIGSFAGMIRFRPDAVSDDLSPPPVVFTNFFLANQPVPIGDSSALHQAIDYTEAITLTYTDRVVSFEFAALSYQASHQNRYRYMLEGFDTGWTEVDATRRLVTYTNLNAGTYVFRVTGSNSTGVWSQAGRAISLIVTPPWWATWWFHSLALALVLGAVAAGYLWRVNRLRTQQRRLEVLVAERTEALAQANQQLVIAKEQAEAANLAKSTFLATMSHELRTPLHTIMGYNRLMLGSPALPQEQRERALVVQRGADHLLTVINNVLDLSKIEAGQIPLQPTTVNLTRLIDGLAAMFRLQAERKGLRLRCLVEADSPRYIVVDTVKLRQVLINLLGNAVKFTQAGAVTLTMRCDRRDGQPQTASDPAAPPDVVLAFEVADTGPGLTLDEQQQMFEAFVQTQAGQHLGDGTGLGLTISRQFVRLMGGKLTVHSTLGHGTVFEVYVPAQIARASPARREETRERALALAPGQPPYRILVVDDHDDNRLLLMSLLTSLGLTVRGARDGEEAMAVWWVWQPHLIFLDLQLPHRNGLDIARHMRERGDERPPAIVAVSASGFDTTRAAALAAGCNDFIRKPFQQTEIVDVMAYHLGMRFTAAGAATPAKPPPAPADFLNPTLLATLPDDLLALLERVSVEGHPRQVAAAIAEVGRHTPALGTPLQALADQFAFDDILEAVRGAQKAKGISADA